MKPQDQRGVKRAACDIVMRVAESPRRTVGRNHVHAPSCDTLCSATQVTDPKEITLEHTGREWLAQLHLPFARS